MTQYRKTDFTSLLPQLDPIPPARASPTAALNATDQAVTSPGLTRVVPSLSEASQTSSLLNLPVELRLQILRHLLVRENPIALREVQLATWKHPYRRGYRLAPAILRTCQQLYNEAVSVLYHENTLEVNIAMHSAHQSVSFPPASFELASEPLSHLFLPNSYLPSSSRPKLLPFTRYRNEYNTAQVSIGDEEHILELLDGIWYPRNGGLNKTAYQFRNFLVTVKISSYTQCLGLDLLRHMLRQFAPLFSAKNVEVIIHWPSRLITEDPLITETPSATLTKEQIRLIRSFQLLRCSEFQFASLEGPSAVAVRDIIINDKPVAALELRFLFHPNRILQLLQRTLDSGSARARKLQGLDSRLTQAIKDFDVDVFLQARLEVLQAWQEFVQNVVFNFRLNIKDSEQQIYERFDVKNHLHNFNVYASSELGLELHEDGKELNLKLRDIARRHKFVPVIRTDANEWTTPVHKLTITTRIPPKEEEKKPRKIAIAHTRVRKDTSTNKHA